MMKSPPSLACGFRRAIVPPRYQWQMMQARWGYDKHGSKYCHTCLFVAGLPKSGTTWMESMLASYPGFREITVPEPIEYEVETGGSHDFDFPSNLFARMEETLGVLKLHVHGSAHNAQILKEADVPYLIMYRDLRDVAVSHVFYVQRTPWHPEHPDYKGLSIEEGLQHFGKTLICSV